MAPPFTPTSVPVSNQPPDTRAGSIAATIPLLQRNAQLERTDSPDAPNASNAQKVADFIALSIKRWRTTDTAESALRMAHRKDLDFYASEQWPQNIKNQRNEDGRPCLTINRLPGFVRLITNEAREGRPGIEVDPVDSGADPDLAEVIMGLVQHIEANSDADVAYQTAVQAQARIGRGWFRIVPEYADENSFEQELKVKRIRNQFTVYADPAYQELDGHDMRWLHIVEDIPRDAYIERFGKGSLSSLDLFARTGERKNDWMPEGAVRVAEYYCFTGTERTIHRLEDGTVIDAQNLKRPDVLKFLAARQVSAEPVATRKVRGRQLCWCIHNAVEILEGNEDKSGPLELPGKWIPAFPVVGEEIDLDGRVDYRGVVRDAIDAQRMSNYWKSAMTESVALAPKAPFIAEEGQIEGHETEWQQANVKNIAVLKYKKQSINGTTIVPPPQRNFGEPPIQAMSHLQQQAENDLRATAGFSYDVASQEMRPEVSGKAILARQKQGELSNSHFSANLAVALRHAGRVLIDLIPHYYDTPRVKRILGRDGQPRQVVLHAGNAQAANDEAQRQNLAEAKIYDLSIGRFDVRVKAGVSFLTQRQQDRELMTNAIQAAPQLLGLIGDLYFESLDSPISRRIAKRLQKALPPNLQETEGQPNPIPPEVQAKIQEDGARAQQVIDALTEQVNALSQEKEAKTAELEVRQLEIASRERIANLQVQSTRAVAEEKLALDEKIALLEAKLTEIEQLTKLKVAEIQAAHEDEQQEAARVHERTMAHEDRATEDERIESEHEHALTLEERKAKAKASEAKQTPKKAKK